MQVQLIVEDKTRSGQVIPINTPSFTIGREEGCNLRSGSSQTSPHHCLIRINEGVISIRDLHSETGTFVNGTKILSTTILQEGDKIEVGKHSFILSTQDRAEIVETTDSPEPEDIEEDTGILFDLRLEGQRLTVTKTRLFQLAKQGMLLPDDVVTIDGTKVFADTIQDIVFGDKQPAKPSSHLAPEPAVYTIQETLVAKDISPTDSVWNRFVDTAAASSDASSVSEVTLDTELPDPDEEESDPFNIKDEPVVQVVLPSKTTKSVLSEIGDAIAPSLNQVVTTERKEMIRPYYIPAGYALGILCLLGLLGFLVSGSSSPPGIFYVEGTVLLDGAPIAGVSVTLNPRDETGVAAGGMTDSKGKFTVTTGTAPVGSGAKKGEYDITFRKTELDTLGFTLAEFKRKYGTRKPDTKYIVPQKYEKPDKSGLAPIKVVSDGSNKFKFELTSPPTLKNVEVVKQQKNESETKTEKAESPVIPVPTPPVPVAPPANDLFLAARSGTVREVAALLDKRADINAHDPFGQTALHLAIFNNHDEAVALLLISKGADVNAKDRYDDSPLLLAVRSSHSSMDVVNALISKGADVNAKDRNERSALHMTAFAPPSVNPPDNKVEVLKVLLSEGAFVNQRDRTGKTPLDVANTEEKKDILRAAGGIELPVSHPVAPPAENALENPFVPAPVPPPISEIEEVPSISATQPPDVQYNVGLNFFHGTKDIPQNKAEALKWFHAAAKQGHAESQFQVGRHYYFGWEVAANESEGINWIQKAADQGYKGAVNFLQYLEHQKAIFGPSP